MALTRNVSSSISFTILAAVYTNIVTIIWNVLFSLAAGLRNKLKGANSIINECKYTLYFEFEFFP